jgi:hypothetical protein
MRSLLTVLRSRQLSQCAVLFIVAFRDLGHLSWAIPAMTLFALTGISFLGGLIPRLRLAS